MHHQVDKHRKSKGKNVTVKIAPFSNGAAEHHRIHLHGGDHKAMKENTKNMTNLTMDERFQLMREIALAEKVMMSLFPCDQDNVAMIGNMTPQLHVHIVCRKKGDPDWPGTVWNSASAKYEQTEKEKIIAKIRQALQEEMQNQVYQISK